VIVFSLNVVETSSFNQHIPVNFMGEKNVLHVLIHYQYSSSTLLLRAAILVLCYEFFFFTNKIYSTGHKQ